MSNLKPKLQSTSDYLKFELCQFNRDVSKTKALKESMRAHGYIPSYPIHAVVSPSGKLQIKAGHHRFEVAQQLGISVFYVVSDDSATVHELEKATAKWTTQDYQSSFIRCGMEHYIELEEFQKSSGIPLGLCVAILGGQSASSGNKLQGYKSGEFIVTDAGRKHAADVQSVFSACKKVSAKACNATFVRAISRCLFVPEFDKAVFINRVESNWNMLRPCGTVVLMMEVIESIYNMRTHEQNRLPIVFLADKAMKNRVPIGKKS